MKFISPTAIVWSAAALVLSALAGCDVASHTTARVELISREAALAMAQQEYPRQLRAMAAQGYALNADDDMAAWSREIATRLVVEAVQMHPHTENWEWEINLVSTDELNAWCMAGGKMALYTGLVEATQRNPHRVAMVLGHEIAHALLEHSRQTLSREGLLTSSLWIASKSFKVGAARAQQISQDLHLAFKPLERQEERDADALGLELMARAGFDPQDGAKVWLDFQHRQTGAGEQRLMAFLSDHPMNEERLQTLTALAAKQPKFTANAVKGGGL